MLLVCDVLKTNSFVLFVHDIKNVSVNIIDEILTKAVIKESLYSQYKK
jgi:hypothetical protein